MIKQHDLYAPRGKGAQRAGSPTKHQRLRSEPVNLNRLQWEVSEGNGRPRTVRLPEEPSRPPALLPPSTTTQCFPLDDSLTGSNLDKNTVAAAHDALLSSPLNGGAEPRVVQPVVPPSELIVEDSETIDQESTAVTETLSPQTPHVAGRSITFDSPRLRPGPGPGPGPQPGPGTESERKALPLPRTKSEPRLPLQRTIMSLGTEWQEIHQRRVGTWNLRSRIHVLRRELRVRQQAKSTADDRLLKYFRSRILDGQNTNQYDSDQQESLSRLLQDCELARAEYGPLEDDCNMLEDQLDRAELELTRLEEKFHSLQIDPRTVPVGMEDLTRSSTNWALPASSAGSDEFTAGAYHPLVARYLSKMGDVDILQERLAEHVEEKDYLENEKESRQRVGLHLAKDDQEWLRSYRITEAELLQEIKEAKAEAEKLKKQCLDGGLVDEHGEPTSIETWERRNFHEEDMDAGSETSEFMKFPALIPRPVNSEILPQSSEFFDNTDDRINYWLLAHLRSSPLDVNLLARTYESQYGPLTKDWQEHVLTLWYKDGTRKGVHEYRLYSSSAQTQPPLRARQPRPVFETGEDEPQSILDRHFSVNPIVNSKGESLAGDELRLADFSTTFRPGTI